MKRIHVDVRVEHDTPYDARHRMLNALEVMGFKGGWKGDVLETSAKESFSTFVIDSHCLMFSDSLSMPANRFWANIKSLYHKALNSTKYPVRAIIGAPPG